MPNGRPLLHVPMESKGIIYAKLHFDTSCVPQDLIPYTGLLTELLGKLDTDQYSYQELPTIKNQYFGGLSFHNTTIGKNKDDYRSFVVVKMKLLKEDLVAGFSVIQNILLNTNFDMVENIKKIVKSAKIKGEYELQNNTHYYSIFYSGSNLFPALHIDDLTSGIRYFRFLTEIDTKLEEETELIIENLKKVAEMIFCNQNMEVAVGCENEDFPTFKNEIIKFHMPEKSFTTYKYKFDIYPQKNAFTNTNGIVYNITSFDYKEKNIAFHGKFNVLHTIINLEYLWNKIRVQGGAYGCGCKFLQSGFSYFYSYRDPNLTETYDVYRSLAEEISTFEADDREMTKYILGTINELDQPKTNMDKLNAAINKFYKDISDESIIRQRQEILHTTALDIRQCAELLKLVTCENICTIGNEQKIKANKEYFNHIEPFI